MDQVNFTGSVLYWRQRKVISKCDFLNLIWYLLFFVLFLDEKNKNPSAAKGLPTALQENPLHPVCKPNLPAPPAKVLYGGQAGFSGHRSIYSQKSFSY